MKRIFVGLTILLFMFLSEIQAQFPFGVLSSKTGIPDSYIVLLTAIVGTALFFIYSSFRRRLIFPIPGIRLLTTGAILFLLTCGIATFVFMWVLGALGGNGANSNILAVIMSAAFVGAFATPLLYLAKILLILGAFRMLTNLATE